MKINKVTNKQKYKSSLELTFETYWKALAKDLPLYSDEFKFHPKRKWRFDYAWPDKKIALELDGGTWLRGGGRHNRDSDREKMNAAVLLGWKVLRFSGEQLKSDPKYVFDCLRGVLS